MFYGALGIYIIMELLRLHPIPIYLALGTFARDEVGIRHDGAAYRAQHRGL